MKPRMHTLGRCAMLVAVPLVLVGCAGDGGGGADENGRASIAAGDRLPASAGDGEASSGLEHVHGIGRNPADGTVMLATHYGLWRLPGDGDPELVGEYRHDLMGFSVVGADRFIASGHPNGAPQLPAHLGLIETTDGGVTWRSVSLLGEADFHALHVAGEQAWGWNSENASLMVSDDMREWRTRSEGSVMVDFAVAPDDPQVVVAGVAVSRTVLGVARSTDGGRTFTRLDSAPQAGRFVWPEADHLVGFALDGGVHRSSDAGATWRRAATLDSFPDAVAATADELLAAANGAVYSSGDGGRSWKLVRRYAG